MKIRRKSEKAGQGATPDGVPPLHTLITCTYQKLFKKDGVAGFDNGAGWDRAPGHGTGHVPGGQHKRQKLQRHELGSSWANGGRLREAEEEGNNLSGVNDVEKQGEAAGHDKPHDTHEARTNPLLPKRRKVKSTRYADFTDEPINGILHSSRVEKRSRKIDKDNFTAQDAADYINTVASSKEALIGSIFYVFDTLGKSALTASEVVAIMLEQGLPGLKEGGARHTVQVANVLRRSRHFISIGNKQYLPCQAADDPVKKPNGRNGQASKSKQVRADSCKLYDGSGWHCTQEAHPGFSLCVLHLEMINRPLGKVQAAPTSALKVDEPVKEDSTRSQQHEEDRESDSDREESEDIGPALAKWGRDRTPGSAPNQKRKMLSLMSLK